RDVGRTGNRRLLVIFDRHAEDRKGAVKGEVVSRAIDGGRSLGEGRAAGRRAGDVGRAAVVGGSRVEGHVARTGARRRVHRDVGRTEDARLLVIFDRHAETASGAVAVAVVSGAIDGGRSLGEGRAAGRRAGDVGRAAVVGGSGVEGDVARTGPRRRVHRDVGRTEDARLLVIFDRHAETASGAVAVAVVSGAIDGGRSLGKGRAAGRRAGDVGRAAVVGGSRVEGDVARTGPRRRVRCEDHRTEDARLLEIFYRLAEAASGAVAVAVVSGAIDGGRSLGKCRIAGRCGSDDGRAAVVRGSRVEGDVARTGRRRRVHGDVGR